MSFASNRDSGIFSGKTYKKAGFLQEGYNEIFLDSVVECIKKHFSTHAPNKRLRVLDLGSGTGKSSRYFLNKLLAEGVSVAYMEGRDISPSQVSESKEFKNDLLEFKVEAAESLTDTNQFDVIICLFSYHWFQEKEKVAEKIKSALTEDGVFFALIPIEKPRLFALRQANLSLWKPYLEMEIKPLEKDPQFYLDIFSRQFPHIQSQDQRNHHQFSEEKFSEWMGGWTSESRKTNTKTRSKRPLQALTSPQKRQMLSTLTAAITEDKNEDIYAETQGPVRVIHFGERVIASACSAKPMNFTLEAPNVAANNEKANSIKCFK